MKKLLILFLLLGFTVTAQADTIKLPDFLKDIPDLKQGFAYSLYDEAFNYTTSVTAARWEFIDLDIGYAGTTKENTSGHKIIGALTADLKKINIPFIEFPILKYIEPSVGFYAGLGNLNTQTLSKAEFDAGILLYLVKVKF